MEMPFAAAHESAFGTKLPIRDVCCLVVVEGKADVAQTAPFGSE
jgi:hypothetical protein